MLLLSYPNHDGQMRLDSHKEIDRFFHELFWCRVEGRDAFGVPSLRPRAEVRNLPTKTYRKSDRDVARAIVHARGHVDGQTCKRIDVRQSDVF